MRKWSLIVIFCGAHSFFWGVMVNGDWRAMIAGLITVILAFSLVESHAAYQRRRAAAPRLARALDCGVKLRLWLTVGVFLSIALMSVFARQMNSPFSMLILWPYMGEVMIGMGASELCHWVTGLQLVDHSAVVPLSGLERFVATYLTTLITGAMHTIILGVICLLAYGVIRLRSKAPQPEQPNT